MTPVIGESWHDRWGQNVFVSDLVTRLDTFIVKFETERGDRRECPLSEFTATFRRGYAL